MNRRISLVNCAYSSLRRSTSKSRPQALGWQVRPQESDHVTLHYPRGCPVAFPSKWARQLFVVCWKASLSKMTCGLANAGDHNTLTLGSGACLISWVRDPVHSSDPLPRGKCHPWLSRRQQSTHSQSCPFVRCMCISDPLLSIARGNDTRVLQMKSKVIISKCNAAIETFWSKLYLQ